MKFITRSCASSAAVTPQDHGHAAAVPGLSVCVGGSWLGCAVVAGVRRLVMDGEQPARVPDAVIREIRSRERGGFVELPKPRGLAPGMRVRVTSGPLHDQIGMLASLRPRERVLVLLHLLGGEQRVELARNAIVEW
jgi:transcription antitermination factor NusG